ANQTSSLGPEALENHPALKSYVGKQVVLGIRPEDLEDAALESDAPPERQLRGRLELKEALGSEIIAHFAIKGAHAETDETRELAHDAGAQEAAHVGAREGEAVVVGRFGARSRIKEGEQVEAVVDTRALHFFDLETGQGIYDSPKGATS